MSAVTDDEYDVVEMLGTKVVEVPDLGTDVIYVPGADVALVNPDLSPAQRDSAADWILIEAAKAP